MGRWTTPEQAEFLSNYVARFQEAKDSNNTPALNAIIQDAFTNFAEKWGQEYWHFNNGEKYAKRTDDTDESVFLRKKEAMATRIYNWLYYKTTSKAVKSRSLLLDLSGNKKAKGFGRQRMAKRLDKYHELYIKPNSTRQEELDALYKAYKEEKKEANENPQNMMNWRASILSKWYEKESVEVRDHVERSRREEMERTVVEQVNPGDNDEEKRLKKAMKQEEATSRLPASIFALGKELEEQAMAKGMIMISAPVPSQKKIIIFQSCFGKTLDTDQLFESHHTDFKKQVLDQFAAFVGKSYASNIRAQMSLERMLENAVSAAGRVEETGLTVSVVNCSEDPDKTPAEQPPASSSRKAKRDRSKTRRRNGTDPGFSESSEDEDEDEDGDESESEGEEFESARVNNGRKVPMTPYELQREETIAKNKALFEKLNIGEAVAAVTFSRSKNAKATKATKTAKTAKPNSEVVPTRRSARISRAPAALENAINTERTDSADSQPQPPPIVPHIPPSTVEEAQVPDVPLPAAVTAPPTQAVELTFPLGVPSTTYEEHLEARERILTEPDKVSPVMLQPLPPDGPEAELFPIFDLQELGAPVRPAAKWIVEAERYLCDTLKGHTAKYAVRHWLDIERALGFPGNKDGFPSQGRPKAVSDWQKRGRKLAQIPPTVTDAQELAKHWLTWWVSLQPTARRTHNVDRFSANLHEHLSKPNTVGVDEWDQLCLGGPNGLFLFLVMLSWLKKMAITEHGNAFYDIAMMDVEWALSKILLHLKARKRSASEFEGSDNAQPADPGALSKRRRLITNN